MIFFLFPLCKEYKALNTLETVIPVGRSATMTATAQVQTQTAPWLAVSSPMYT